MIIDIRKLNTQKRYSGSMEFEYSAPEELIEIPFVKFSAPVKIVFDFELFEDDSIEIKGKIFYRLEGQCSRCLKEAYCDVEGEISAYFEPTTDCEDYSYSGGIVRLEKAFDDAIMVSMPFTISCGEDCKGLEYFNQTDN